jgi:tRNA threonylcarbamoyladenosine biosynthesis protein TsaB
VALVITLVLEASTYAGSVALLDGGHLLAERSVAMRGREHEALMPAVAEVLTEAGHSPQDLERVVCGAGPGAFTSLRIAGGIAKGIAMAAGIPLIPVSSLALLVASQPAPRPGRYLAALDAMRDEHYVELFDLSADGIIQPMSGLVLVPSSDVERVAAEQGATALGPDRGQSLGVAPHARGAALITNLIDATAPADLAAWEPAYGRLAEAQVKWEAAHGRPLEVV